MKIKVLKAFNGDAILLSFKEGEVDRNILIDGGMPATYFKKDRNKLAYGDLKTTMDAIKSNNQKIDLLILTHIDDDHIGGIIKWLENDETALDYINTVWFNSGRLIKETFESDKENKKDYSIAFNPGGDTNTSVPQGVKFEDFIETKKGLWQRELILTGMKQIHFGLEFKILSPDHKKLELLLKKWGQEDAASLETAAKSNDYNLILSEHIAQDVSFDEDDSPTNGSSISFILTYKGKNLLFLGDSHPTIIIKALTDLGCSKAKPLKAELVKLSHHGSMYNNNKDLLEILDCKKFIVSTNGDKHFHPHKRLLARLINLKNDCEIYFNYPELIDQIFKREDIKAFNKFKALALNDSIDI